MKNLRYKFILVVLISIIAFAGFTQANAAVGEEGIKFNVYLAGATPAGGGVWDMIGAGLAEAIMRGNKNSVVTVLPGGGVADVPMVSSGQAELGLTHNTECAAALKGTDPFDQKYENIRGICSFYGSVLQFVVNPEAKIESISAIKKNKIPIRLAVGDPGSGGEINTRNMLKAYGMSYEDIESWGGKIYYKDMSEAAGMLTDGSIDAFVIFTLAPAGPILDLSFNTVIQLLSIDEEIIQKMANDYGFSAAIIPQSAYAFLSGDIKTFTSATVLITNDKQSEEVIYNITRGLVENLPYIQSIHSNLKNLTIEYMLTGIGAPLHPGAEKYYKEIGAIK